MSLFFTCIILIGSGITLFSLFLMLAEKKRLHDYRTDLKESKENLIKVIEDAELLVSEMNNFAEYIVTQLEDENESLLSNIAEADLRIDMLSSLPVPTIEAEKIYDEESVSRILEEEGRPEEVTVKNSPVRKGKVLTFDLKRREIKKQKKSGLDSTEIARILNCGKGEIELISRMGR